MTHSPEGIVGGLLVDHNVLTQKCVHHKVRVPDLLKNIVKYYLKSCCFLVKVSHNTSPGIVFSW
jgi:hypothetical protein